MTDVNFIYLLNSQNKHSLCLYEKIDTSAWDRYIFLQYTIFQRTIDG